MGSGICFFIISLPSEASPPWVMRRLAPGRQPDEHGVSEKIRNLSEPLALRAIGRISIRRRRTNEQNPHSLNQKDFAHSKSALGCFEFLNLLGTGFKILPYEDV